MGAGKTTVLFSGEVTGNSYDYRKFNTLGFGVTQVNLEVDEVSTVGWTLDYAFRGYPAYGDAPGYTVPIASDISIGSGYIAQHVFDDAYETLDVGVKNTTTDQSGKMTVTVTGKRRQ